MPAGRLHIFELGKHPGKYGETIPEFQVNYSADGNTFIGVMEEEKLRSFLNSKAAVSPDSLDSVMAELRRNGQLTLTDIEIPESEAPALGLNQQPGDY